MYYSEHLWCKFRRRKIVIYFITILLLFSICGLLFDCYKGHLVFRIHQQYHESVNLEASSIYPLSCFIECLCNYKDVFTCLPFENPVHTSLIILSLLQITYKGFFKMQTWNRARAQCINWIKSQILAFCSKLEPDQESISAPSSSICAQLLRSFFKA